MTKAGDEDSRRQTEGANGGPHLSIITFNGHTGVEAMI